MTRLYVVFCVSVMAAPSDVFALPRKMSQKMCRYNGPRTQIFMQSKPGPT